MPLFPQIVFAGSLIHYSVPPSWLAPVHEYRFLFRWVIIFFVVAMSLSPVKAKVGRFRHVLTGTDYIVDLIASDQPVWSVLHVGLIIICVKLFVKIVFLGGNVLLFLLFRATVFTYSLVTVIVGFGSVWPIMLVVVLPAVRRVAWYYLLAYFALCGGACFLSSLALLSATNFLWREIVLKDIRTQIGWNR